LRGSLPPILGSARKNNEPIHGYLTPGYTITALPLLAAKEWEFFTANGSIRNLL
jgi:hypothetical protein